MNSSNQLARLLALAAAIALSGGAAAQQAAGRVLVAVGTVSIERAGTRIPGAAGTEVQKGDTIQVGPQSNAQLRLADESIVALRADTTFRITEFNFTSGGGEKDSAFFSLLKGGIRTVTGLIGKSDPNSYKVDTPTSTIGIRGTHYTLRVCNDDCVETTTTANGPALPIYLAAASSPVSDAGPLAQLAQGSGTTVPNGTYGSVTEGRISVSNQSGVREFGADQYFRVASRTAAPQQLIGPPSFLRDRLEGRGRGNQQRTSGQQQGSSGGSQQSGSGGSQQSGSSTTQQGGASQSSGSTSDSSASASTSTASSTSSSGSETASTMAPTGAGGGSGDSRTSSSVATPTLPVAITPTLTQVTNQVSTSGPASVLQLTGASQNNVYRFAGTGLNITGSCSLPPCGITIAALDAIVQVNPTSQTARIVIVARAADGGMINVANSYGDFPVTIVGSQQVINGTANSADFPTQAGAFRCNDCGVGNSVSVLQTTTYSVTISGSTATLTFTGTDPVAGGGGTFTFSVPLTLTPQTSFVTAAIAGRNFSTNGGAGVFVQLNAAGQPVFIGEPLQIGNNLTSIGSASNVTIGGNASAGNIVWGTWNGPVNYVNGVYGSSLIAPQPGGSVSPWIIGDQTNVLPSSLGVVSFTPIGSVVGNGSSTTGTLNSATLTADFVNRNLAVSINATNSPGGATFQMNGNAVFSAINGRFGVGFTSVTCTGGSCGTGNNGQFNGFFSGANAAGAGIAFSAANTGAGVVGVIGFKR